MIWNKFKSQFITLLVSIILIAVIFSVYEDLHKVLKISDKDSVVGLLLIKWFLISLIFGYNWYSFSKLKPKLDNFTDHKVHSSQKISENNIKKERTGKFDINSQQHKNILNKKKLKTKTDVILQKYLDNQS